MKLPRLPAALAAVAVLAATLTATSSTAFPLSAAADDNPTTAALTSRCTAEPTSSTGTAAGLAAVAPGETLTVSSTLTLDAGEAFQDVVARPDGSTYFASVIELDPVGASGATIDLSTVTFDVGGVATSFTPGTQPSPDGYVLDSTGGRLRMYFPGDAAAMLANVAGAGLPSIVVPADGTEFVLSVQAAVGTDPSIATGVVLDVATCRASMSTGPSARTTGDRPAKVAVAEPRITIEKSVTPLTVSADGFATFTIKVANPASSPDAPVGTAYDVEVVDTLPADLIPVTGSGILLADGDVNSSGLRWNAAARTLTSTLARIEAGATARLTLRVQLAGSAATASSFVNDVSAAATSLPGSATPERSYLPVDARATLNSAATAPVISKTADRESVVLGNGVTFTATVTLPPNSHYDNFTLVDVLPPGMNYQWNPQVTCTGCTTGPTVIDLGADNPLPNMVRFGTYLGTIDTGAAPATITWRYSAWTNRQFSDGTQIPQGHVFTNTVEYRANIVDRLGGVPPRLTTLRAGDFQASTTKDVVAGEPALTISKRLIGTSPVDPGTGDTEWEVTLTNSGPVDATNVYVYDNDMSPAPGLNTGALSVLSPAGDFFQVSGNLIGVRRVPANGSFTFQYRVPWLPSGSMGPSPVDYRITNVASVNQYGDPYGVGVPIYNEIRASAEIDLLRPDIELTKELLSPAITAVGTPAEYRVTLTNRGPGSATNVNLSDVLPAQFGPLTMISSTPVGAVDCTGSGTIQCALTPNRVAPGQTVTFDYRVGTDNAPTGLAPNAISLSYTDGANRAQYTDASGVHTYAASDSVDVTLVAPRLTLAKTPELDDPGATIDVGGSSTFYMVATNTGNYLATEVVIDDPIPAHLSADLANTTCVVFPPSPDSTCAISGPASHPVFTVDRLSPGAEMRVHMPVTHDGSDPKVVGSEFGNVASLSALGFATITDEGGLNAQSGPKPPLPTKTVSPTVAGPGETVTYTVDVALQNANATVYDATLVDTLPDGLTDITPLSITCVAGSCPPSLAFIGFEPSPNGGGRAAWFIGDQPLGTTGTVRVVYTARVAETFVGGGIPIAGTRIRDGVPGGDPLKNAARVWFNDGVDRYITAPPAVPATTTSQFTSRSVNTRVSLDIATPSLDLTKSASKQSIEAGDRSNPLSVETYTLTVTNSGSRSAFAVDIVDDMAAGELRDVLLDGVPTGVAVVEPWSMADSSTTFRIAELAAGATATITYTAVPRTTGEVYDSRYRVRNTAAIAAFHSTADGTGPGDYTYPAQNPVTADVWVYTPQPRVGAAGCSDPDAVGEEVWFSASVSNSHWQGTPNLPDVGTLFDGVLTVTIGANSTFVAGSVLGTPFGGTEAPFRDPDSLVVNADLSTTMTWDVGDVPINNGATFLDLRWKVNATALGTAGLMVSLDGVDRSGAPARGGSVGATTPYLATNGAGCVTSRNLQKSPDTGTIRAGNQLTWNATFSISTTYRHDQTEVGDFVDTLPAGFIYTPGTATFSDGSTPAMHSETIVALPDGSTRITWKNFTVTAPAGSSGSISVSIPTRTVDEATLAASGPLPRPFVNLIGFTAHDPGDTGLAGDCNGLQHAICDTGTITVESNNQPTVSKQVDHEVGPWGDTATFTVDISIPKNYATAGLFARDIANVVNLGTPYWPTNQPQLAFAPVSASCVLGCTPGGPDDISVTSLPPVANSGYALATAWKTGTITTDSEPRTLRIVYEVQTPTIDDVAALPNCATYGFSTEGYYSCGKATFRNTVDLYSAYSSLAGVGANWWNTWWWWGSDYRGSATADFAASVPDVRIEKQCGRPGATPEGPTTSEAPTQLEQSALGVANVACTLTVTNDGPGTAYYVEFDDLPSGTSYYGWQVDWDLRSNVTPAPATVDTAPTNGTEIAWTLPELAEGSSYSASFEARASLPSWAAGIRTGTGQNYGTRFSNTANIRSYDPDDFGSVHIADTGNWWSNWNNQRRRSTTWLDISTPRVHLAKQVNVQGGVDPATRIGDPFCPEWQQLTVDGHPVCIAPNNGERLEGAQPLEYHLNILLDNADQLRTADLTDTLPLGWSYVPGSATLDHLSWDAAGTPTTTSTPLFDPTATPTDQTSCAWWNVTGYGDRLQWIFSRAATDQGRALWDDALRWTGASANPSAVFDTTYRITFRAEPNAMWEECRAHSTPGWDPIGPNIENQAMLSVTSTSDESAQVSTGVSVRDLDPPRFIKAPNDGFVTADGDAVFTLDTENVQKFGIDDVTVTDVVSDWSVAAGAPLYQPGSATFTDEFGDPVDATEVILHRSTGPGDPSIISWTFDQRPAYSAGQEPRIVNWNCPVSGTPDRPYWSECASRVRITMTLHVPDSETDGYQFANEAVAEFPIRTYDPEAANYDAFGTFEYGATLGDAGRYTVVNPSPPPAPSKWGTYWATPNDDLYYSIGFTVPAGTTYHDLAYTDVLPDGLEDISVSNVSVTDPSTGQTRPFPAGTIIGPVTDPTDHTTAVGVYFGDVPGINEDRYVQMDIRAKVSDEYADGTRVEAGDRLTDTVTGYANEDDLDSGPPPSPVTSAQHESVPATATTNIDEPDVRIEKLADRPGPLAAGDQVNYTLRITNVGNVPAFRVPVEDHPNAALTDVRLTGDTSYATKGWTDDDPSLAWELPYLYPGQVWDLSYTATVSPDPQSVPAIVNTASVGTYQARQQADAANREYDGPEATHTIRFLSADLRLDKVPNPTGAAPCPTEDPSSDEQGTSIGRSTPWCVTVTNAGELTAGGVTVRDLLPPSWTYDAGTASAAGAPLEPTVTDAFGLQLLRWDLGDLAPGSSVEIRYTATPEAGSPATVTNTAWAIAGRPDGSPAPDGAPGFRADDDAAAALRTVGVEIAKTPDRQVLPLAPAGGRAPWTITVTNPAATDLTNVVVTDHFPPGVTYVPTATTSTCAGSIESASAADAAGQFVTWRFPFLAVGDSCSITVAADVPAGLTGPTTFVNDAQVETDQTPVAAANQAKLVVYEPAALGDRVWHDRNGNGIQDAGEPGYGSVVVTVEGTDIEGNPISRTAVTDADGRWLVDLPPGTYRVAVDVTTLPPSWQATSALSGGDRALDSDVDDAGSLGTVLVASGDRRLDLDAGFLESTASLSGRRWHDRNGNGVQDPGEPPLAGITVTLSGSDMFGNSGSLTTVTDADGRYEFLDLPALTGTITFGDDPGQRVTTQYAGGDPAVDSDADRAGHTIAVTLFSGQHLGHLDEGTYEGVTVRGTAWSDVDRDGIRSNGEPGRTGVVVTLVGLDGAGAPVSRTSTTDSNGDVEFSDLPPGEYSLHYGPDASAPFSPRDVGDDATDSDVATDTGATGAVTAVDGSTVRPGDAGYMVPTNVSITKTVIDGPTPERLVTYRMRVSNTGDFATVGDIAVIDDLPVGLTGVSVDGGGWSCTLAADAVGCSTTEPLAPGSFHDVILVARVAEGAPRTVTNRAVVASTNATDNSTPTDDADSAVVLTQAVAAPTPSTPPSSTTPPATTAPTPPRQPTRSGGSLAFTGADAGALFGLGLAAILVGVGLTSVLRRRARAGSPRTRPSGE